MKEALDRMPDMGLLDSIKHTLMHFLISIIGTIGISALIDYPS